MIQTGKNITTANDPLSKTDTWLLFQTITNPNDELRSKIHQLRIISTIDKNKYRQLKTTLPYFVCGIFSPPYRKTENFGYIEHFVLDIDHLSDKQLNINDLKATLTKDQRIELMFASPGNDGLKIMFRLSEKCYDSAKYSLFYKIFALDFSKRYNLMQAIDDRTSDVTRACFLSYDHNAYFNKNPEPVNMNAYIDFENTLEIKNAEILIKKEQKENPPPAEEKKPIPNDVFKEIRQRLNPNIRQKPEKIIFVPEKLNEVIDDIKKNIEENGIAVTEIVNIHYGKKIKVSYQNFWAEINVFYGKKGFSVVKSPKNGTNPELCDIVHQIVANMLFNSDFSSIFGE